MIRGKIIEVSGIPNAYMIRKHLALKVGLIPWQRMPWNGEDGYLQYKIKKLGCRIVVIGDARVYHDISLKALKKYNEMRLYHIPRRSRHAYKLYEFPAINICLTCFTICSKHLNLLRVITGLYAQSSNQRFRRWNKRQGGSCICPLKKNR